MTSAWRGVSERVDLAAVIVTHQSAGDVARALESIRREAPPGTPIVVVDEASTDGTPAEVREACPEARLVVEPVNGGFASGVQRAVAERRARRWLILNPDAWLEAGAIAPLAEALDRDPGLAAACPLVRRPEPDGRIDSLGLGISDRLAPFSIAAGRPGDRVPAGGEVFGFHGAAALVRAAILEDLGGLDPRFFCYQEEFDLSWRARRAGWRFLAVPASRVRHRVGASAPGRSSWRVYLLERNRLWALAKNATAAELRRAASGLVAAEASALRYALAAPAPWILAARRDALAGLGRMLRWRRRFERFHPDLASGARAWMGLEEPR